MVTCGPGRQGAPQGPAQRENLYSMDNKNRQDPGMKGNWQTIGMLIVAAVLTFLVVGWMNSTVNARRRQELSYNEFVKMVDEGKVESISVGNSEISVHPKEGDPNYSQQITLR